MELASIVPIRVAEGPRHPLFLVHGVGGNVIVFVNLVRHLDEDQPVYGIQAQALRHDQPILIDLRDMAAFYLREVRQVQPRGPYAFLGLSYGGLVAYEMAQQLSAAGETVHLLGMLDTWQPGFIDGGQAGRQGIAAFKDRIETVRMNTQKLSATETVTYLAHRLGGRVLRLLYRKLGSRGAISLPDSMRRVRDINLMAGANYKVKPYPGKVTLFRAAEDYRGFPEDLGWGRFAEGGLDIRSIPGDHGQVLAEPNVTKLAQQVTTCLLETQAVLPERIEFDLDLEESLPLPEVGSPHLAGLSR